MYLLGAEFVYIDWLYVGEIMNTKNLASQR